jgi:hypothetical protein
MVKFKICCHPFLISCMVFWFSNSSSIFSAVSSDQQTSLDHEINPYQSLHNDQQPAEPSIHTQPLPTIASNGKNYFLLSPLQRE